MASGPALLKSFPKSDFGGIGRPRVAGDQEATRALEQINTELLRRFGARGHLIEKAVTWKDMIAAGVVRAKDGSGNYYQPTLDQYQGIEVNDAAAPIATGKWDTSASPLRWNRPASTGNPWTGGTHQTPVGLTGGDLIEAQAGGYALYQFETGVLVESGALLSVVVKPGRVNLSANPLQGKFQCDFQCDASIVREIPSFEPVGSPDLSSDPASRNGRTLVSVAVRIRPARVPDAATFVTVSELVWSLSQA